MYSAALMVTLGGCRHTANPSTDKESDKTVQVGYGKEKKTDLAGSVSSVSTEDAKKAPNRDVTEMLRGRVSGVYVTETPNGLVVRVRGVTSPNGNNEPLYVIDGLPVTPGPGGALAGISPYDIASIDVLKGAAAAVYGVRAANGVVVITTKRGRE